MALDSLRSPLGWRIKLWAEPWSLSVVKDAKPSRNFSLKPRSGTAAQGWSLGREAGREAGPLRWGQKGDGRVGGGFGKLVLLPVCAFLLFLEYPNLALPWSLCLGFPVPETQFSAPLVSHLLRGVFSHPSEGDPNPSYSLAHCPLNFLHSSQGCLRGAHLFAV